MESTTPQSDWFVARFDEDDRDVIVRARGEMPAPEERKRYSHLCVITWEYEGGESGMPDSCESARMFELENLLEAEVEKRGLCVQTASRTGNDRREWNYFVRSKEEFMEALNSALGHLPPFPIEICFYDDPEWDSLQDLLACRE